MAIIDSATIPEVRDAGIVLNDFQADERMRQEAWYREKQMHDEASQIDDAIEEGIAIGIEKGITKGREEGIEKGFAKGIEEGIEKGREEERRELLTSFVRDGVITVEEAAKRAGLSVAEFQKLTES